MATISIKRKFKLTNKSKEKFMKAMEKTQTLKLGKKANIEVK